jgi:UPF0176 protein
LVQKVKNILKLKGFNIFLSGPTEKIKEFELEFRKDERIDKDFQFKETYSHEPTYRRMLVRKKKEIVTMGVDDVKPTEAAYVKPKEFQKWLDEKKDMIVLDTRNDYEIRMVRKKNN